MITPNCGEIIWGKTLHKKGVSSHGMREKEGWYADSLRRLEKRCRTSDARSPKESQDTGGGRLTEKKEVSILFDWDQEYAIKHLERA